MKSSWTNLSFGVDCKSYHSRISYVVRDDGSQFWLKGCNDKLCMWIWFMCGSRLLSWLIKYWHLQPFSQDYGLVSYTTHVVCVKFIIEWRFSRNFVMAGLFTYRVFVRNLLSRESQRNIYILFWCLIWDTNPSFTPNRTTHYLLDYLESKIK